MQTKGCLTAPFFCDLSNKYVYNSWEAVMARQAVGFKSVFEPTIKKTSQAGNHSMVKTASMNKNKRRGYKKYRGQGR